MKKTRTHEWVHDYTPDSDYSMEDEWDECKHCHAVRRYNNDGKIQHFGTNDWHIKHSPKCIEREIQEAAE